MKASQNLTEPVIRPILQTIPNTMNPEKTLSYSQKCRILSESWGILKRYEPYRTQSENHIQAKDIALFSINTGPIPITVAVDNDGLHGATHILHETEQDGDTFRLTLLHPRSGSPIVVELTGEILPDLLIRTSTKDDKGNTVIHTIPAEIIASPYQVVPERLIVLLGIMPEHPSYARAFRVLSTLPQAQTQQNTSQ